MGSMRELDHTIRTGLWRETNDVEFSEEIIFQKILVGMDDYQARKKINWGFKQYATALIFALFLTGSSSIAFSPGARVFANDVMQSIKTVFMLDDSGKVVEKPASEMFRQPGLSIRSQLNDSEMSKKLGVNVCFPQTLAGGFVLQGRGEGIGLDQTLDYATYESLKSDLVQAINDEDVFNSLQKYQPFRNVDCDYKNSKGVAVEIIIHNRIVPDWIPEDVKVIADVPVKIAGLEGKWLGFSGADYPDNDVHQKPTGKFSGYCLLWYKDGFTYEITALKDSTISRADAVNLAESFMNAQR